MPSDRDPLIGLNSLHSHRKLAEPSTAKRSVGNAYPPEDLNALSKRGEWVQMGKLIDDEVLNSFAIVGAPEALAPELRRRFGDVVDRMTFYAPYRSDPDRWRQVLDDLKAA